MSGNNVPIRIHFLGAASTVTGSKFLLELPGRTLLVDCGLFQGVKSLRNRNWSPLPVNAGRIDRVLLTHGHLDHTGYLPRLVRMGYTGPIWATAPTADITEIILRDSARLQEEDAERANREGFSRHHPAEPLYSMQDVDKTLPLLEVQPEGRWLPLAPDLRVRFRPNGHILGSAFIEIDYAGRRLVFSGDIGRRDDPLLPDPARPDRADVMIMESTYGDRLHPRTPADQQLGQWIRQTIGRGGTLIIPSFAVERAQLLLYLLWQLRKAGAVPRVPIILDSPMGAQVLKLFARHPGWHRLSARQCRAMAEEIRIVQSYGETWEIVDNPQPKIVIAGSGMVTGGRVLTYLSQYLQRPETTVILAGYQAEGTRGRQLLEGCREIKFWGKYHPVKARIEYLESLSGHADQQELLDWVSGVQAPPKHLFIVHGEPQAADTLRVKLSDTRGWSADIPELYAIREIEV